MIFPKSIKVADNKRSPYHRNITVQDGLKSQQPKAIDIKYGFNQKTAGYKQRDLMSNVGRQWN